MKIGMKMLGMMVIHVVVVVCSFIYTRPILTKSNFKTTLLFNNSSNMVCPIDQLLLESERPFNSKHFDTSFEQIGQKI